MFKKFLSLAIILLTLPILIILSTLIIISDGFPIFFTQKRIGKNNKIFTIYKFRTMKIDTPDVPTHLLTKSDSAYIPIGPFLRKYSLDELPQLLNLLNGDMAFIGPRPALHNQDDLIELRTKVGIDKLLPGVTGWAQVNGRDELSIETKVEKDLFYLKNESIFLDIKIFMLTFFKVFKADGVKS
tara:strand:+ start:324 stop:875 length:552 start_codon:yes stop_codon:yes gene_type:complete